MSLPFDTTKWQRPGYVQASAFMAYMKKAGKLPELDLQNVLMSWAPAFTHLWAKNNELNRFTFFSRSFYNLKDSKTHVFSNLGFGSPSAAILMEELNCLGARQFISLGFAGALNRKFKIGDIVLANRALRDEGTSYNYLSSEEKYVSADSDLLTKVQGHLNSQSIPYMEGSVWTTDAPYRETREEISDYSRAGIDAVEMETSAIYSVAKSFKKPALSVLVITDLLYEEEWAPKFQNKIVNKNYIQLLDLLSRLN